MKVFIGYDHREHVAFKVAEKSLRRHASISVEVEPLNSHRLAERGLLTRPVDTRGGQYDIISNAPMATEFANSRFLSFILPQRGWVLFVDCDVVFLEDVANILAHIDPQKAVMVVKHSMPPVSGEKMDGQQQLVYPRKNWSSVMLINVDHPANRRLSLRDINERPGRDLHAFYWLHDSEIGELPGDWNWLVGVQPKPDAPKLAHFTLGGPFLGGWVLGQEHDDIWLDAAR